jgi:tetratricopeptide (TPR) repeat protein
MNSIVEQSQSSEPEKTYKVEIDAAALDLGAPVTDLQQIIVPIAANQFALQQIPGLIRKSYRRLLKLREVLNDIKSPELGDSGMFELSNKLSFVIQVGKEFSLERASQILEIEDARATPWQKDAKAGEVCGLIKSLNMEFEDAAECYAEAANAPGLSPDLQWYYEHENALMLTEFGAEFNNKPALESAISLLQTKIIELIPRQQNSAQCSTTYHTLGTVMGILGQRQGGTRNLENAIGAFEKSIETCDRGLDSSQWAKSQNSLGNALGILGHRLGDEEMLKQSAEVFHNALEASTVDQEIDNQVIIQNNLAAILQSTGQRNKDTKQLKLAVENYKAVLQVWTRDKRPMDWGATMNNLGTALRLLGAYRKGPRTLEQSVAAYKSALSVRTRDRLPLDWAMSQNNLGAALQKLAERLEEPKLFNSAISAYESALLEWTREKMPMAWGMTMANLAVARRTMAELDQDLESANQAVSELEAVSDIFRHASHAQYSELSIDQLAKARKLVDTLNLNVGKYADLVKR